LTATIVILLSSPGFVFSKEVSFIDTDLYKSSGDVSYVRTKMDFGDNDHTRAFPRNIGDWSGTDYDTSEIEERLGADVMLLRAYSNPKYYQPIFFLIMQGRSTSSFHPPTVCYPSMGYETEIEGKDDIYVQNADWVDSLPDANSLGRSISFKHLVVCKSSEDVITERRVVLYCYVKNNLFTSDTITMIRVSALAPVDGSYKGTLDLLEEFTAQTIPYMFEFDVDEESQTLLYKLGQSGVGGYFAMGFLVLMPLALMIYPRIGKRNSKVK